MARPSQSHDTPVARSAVHEAGHALAALRCTLVRDVYEVSLSDGHEEEGRVRYLLVAGDLHNAWPWCKLVIALAGMAAESLVYQRFRSGHASKDLLDALDMTWLLMGKNSLHPPWKIKDPSPQPLKFDAMFARRLSCDETVILQRGYDTAKSLLRRHQGAHASLVSLLLAHRTLTSQAVHKWFGGRTLITIVGALGRGDFIG